MVYPPLRAVTIASGRRAIDADDKRSRRAAILDAAEALVTANPNQLPSVQEVADAVGLAKGTIYLYFETKEAIYLGLHQRQTHAFFAALIKSLESPKPFTLAVLIKLIDQHMIQVPNFFALGASCMSVAIHAVEPATVLAFHEELGVWLFQSGQLFEQRLPNMKKGDGVRMLHLGYAQMLGLYQLLANSAGNAKVIAHLREQQKRLGLRPFVEEVHAAITVLWQQTVLSGLPTTPLQNKTQKVKTS